MSSDGGESDSDSGEDEGMAGGISIGTGVVGIGTRTKLPLVADTVLDPSLKRDEIDARHDTAAYELHEVNSKPDVFLPEVIHSVTMKGASETLFLVLRTVWMR